MDWKKIKADISRGFKEGADTVKDGADIVARKAGEMSAEGQRKIKIFNTKRHLQDHMEELGVAIYNAEEATPGVVTDGDAKAILEKIDQLQADLVELEKKVGDDKT